MLCHVHLGWLHALYMYMVNHHVIQYALMSIHELLYERMPLCDVCKGMVVTCVWLGMYSCVYVCSIICTIFTFDVVLHLCCMGWDGRNAFELANSSSVCQQHFDWFLVCR